MLFQEVYHWIRCLWSICIWLWLVPQVLTTNLAPGVNRLLGRFSANAAGDIPFTAHLTFQQLFYQQDVTQEKNL